MARAMATGNDNGEGSGEGSDDAGP
jgi:hypothetical protein